MARGAELRRQQEADELQSAQIEKQKFDNLLAVRSNPENKRRITLIQDRIKKGEALAREKELDAERQLHQKRCKNSENAKNTHKQVETHILAQIDAAKQEMKKFEGTYLTALNSRLELEAIDPSLVNSKVGSTKNIGGLGYGGGNSVDKSTRSNGNELVKRDSRDMNMAEKIALKKSNFSKA
jgi:hypothetical protein